MYSHNLIEDTGNQTPPSTALELIIAHLQDLVLIHWEKHFEGQTELASDKARPSLYLHASQYVFGEELGARSSMRFLLHISPDAEAAEGTETVSLTLAVSGRPTLYKGDK